MNLIFSYPKRLLRFLLPGFYKRFSRYNRLANRLIRAQGLTVSHGPFTGMAYIRRISSGSQFIPKLLGSYECEIHQAIMDIISRKPKAIIDVGCAEGYYAVGFARSLPDTKIYAYDIDVKARQLCSELAQLNGVAERIIIRGECHRNDLRTLPLEGSVILSDCEGYELELLDPQEVPLLAKATLLVELHDFVKPGLAETVLSRFQESHAISLIPVQERNGSAYRILEGLKPSLKFLALNEGRQFDGQPTLQSWAYMIPRI